MNHGRTLSWNFEGKCIRCTSHRLDAYGYPRLTRNGYQTTIARFIVVKRWHSPEAISRHTCDNRWCINPAHIIAGTHADNIRDMVERGRHHRPAGVLNPMSKLIDSNVRSIRIAKGTHQEIADFFGVTRSVVTNIKNGRTWKHI